MCYVHMSPQFSFNSFIINVVVINGFVVAYRKWKRRTMKSPPVLHPITSVLFTGHTYFQLTTFACWWRAPISSCTNWMRHTWSEWFSPCRRCISTYHMALHVSFLFLLYLLVLVVIYIWVAASGTQPSPVTQHAMRSSTPSQSLRRYYHRRAVMLAIKCMLKYMDIHIYIYI